MLDERTRMLPVPKPDAILSWNTPKINDQTEDDEKHNEKNLKAGEAEFHLSVDAYE